MGSRSLGWVADLFFSTLSNFSLGLPHGRAGGEVQWLVGVYLCSWSTIRLDAWRDVFRVVVDGWVLNDCYGIVEGEGWVSGVSMMYYVKDWTGTVDGGQGRWMVDNSGHPFGTWLIIIIVMDWIGLDLHSSVFPWWRCG
jgi:hypothetical protein